MANKKLLKTYHGIPKTPIDDNTVFYASLDGTTVAEVGGSLNLGTGSFKQMPTGLGYKFNNGNGATAISVNNLSATEGSIELSVNFDDLNINAPHGGMVSLLDSLGYTSIFLGIETNLNKKIEFFGSKTQAFSFSNDFSVYYTPVIKTGYHFIKATWKLGIGVKLYFDGILVVSTTYTIPILTPTQILIGNGRYNSAVNTYGYGGTLSDISISNIDRGSYFPTLPQDFIDGNARILPAFNEQRQIYSDALTSEYKVGMVKASDTNRSRQQIVTQATVGTWSSGDTIKMSGLTGEIISGVIDSDTALCNIIQTTLSSLTIYVDDVSKIAVSDKLLIWDTATGTVQNTVTVTAIDTVNKIITIAENGYNYEAGRKIIFETTPSSSSPLVKTSLTGTATAGTSNTITLPASFNATTTDFYANCDILITAGTGVGQLRTIGWYGYGAKLATVTSAWTVVPDSTSVFIISKVPVTGTWSNLGTNQATFTLGATAGLTIQDLSIEYSLNEAAGQGGIPEVLTSVLGGEINAKVVDTSFTKISTDFKGKVSGSVVENPNIFKASASTTALQIPSAIIFENIQSYYDLIKILDITSAPMVSTLNLTIPQQLFSFDLIALVERKYGSIPAISVADKVLWLKANLSSIGVYWYGYGSYPSGNKAYLQEWSGSSWVGSSSHTNNTPTSLFRYFTMSNLNSDGFVHFLAYTDASDGVTASTINTDYISLDVTLNYNARLTLSNVPYSIGSRKLAVNPTVHVTDDLLGSNPNIIEYATGDGKIHFEVEGETLDMYAGGVKADFVGKVSGSVVENPNIVKWANGGPITNSLMSPSAFTIETGVSGTSYTQLQTLDSQTLAVANSAALGIPQQLFSFDIIKTYEKKYGVIPSATQSVADKIAWLKLNLTSLILKWYGYGSCPSGNKASLRLWDGVSSWNGSGYNNTSSSPSNINLSYSITSIDTNGFAHFLAYTDAASTTSPTLLVMTGHGLSNYDIVENTTRNVGVLVNSVTANGLVTTTIPTGSLSLQQSGDIINKYHLLATKTALAGTTTTNVVVTAHGLSVGDWIWSNAKGIAKITAIIDANTFTCNSITGMTTGDNIYLMKFTGQQTAEATVIPSTIYTDYVSLDITLKPSYKSVGEDVGGTGVHRLDALSRGKNLFDVAQYLNAYINVFGNGYRIANTYSSVFTNKCKLKANTQYKFSCNITIVNGTGTGAFGRIALYNGTTFIYLNDSAITGNQSKSITTPSDINTYTQMYIYGSSTGTDIIQITDIQLEEGSTATAYNPYVSDAKPLALAQPLRKVSSTVFDKYAEGQVNRNVSDWITLDGTRAWAYSGIAMGRKELRLPLSTLSISAIEGFDKTIKYDGTQLATLSANNSADTSFIGSNNLYLRASNIDTGFCDALIATSNEIKSYFYGYKMCHSDGVSPYQINEVNYTPSTWAEWTKEAGVVGDSSGLEMTGNNGAIAATFPTALKVSTNYGVLFNVVSTTFTNIVYLSSGANGNPLGVVPITNQVGNQKIIRTSLASITTNVLKFFTSSEPTGNKIKIKDIRVFELPIGSQIESDFNTLTADQLTAKYLFYGLNPKNWKSVVDGSGQTATLPVALAPNYTPYKMLYQLATPTVEVVTTTPINAYDFGSIFVDGGVTQGRTNILTGGLLPATSTSWVSASKTNVETLNGTSLSITSNALGNIPQIKVKFNIVDMLEQKYGSLPCPNDIASKVAWVKANLNSISVNDYIFGLGASGNKAYLTVYTNDMWATAISNSSISPSILLRTLAGTISSSIDSNGYAHFISYADQASTTNNTLLVLKAHGLTVWDFIENVTRGVIVQVNAVGGTDRISTTNVVGQTSGDVINKYHQLGTFRLAEAGTTTTNIKITAHGLVTGDIMQNAARGELPIKVTVVDANNFTVSTPLTGQTSGDTIYLFKFTNQQIAEGAIIPSTINMDYISLDVSLKPVTGYDMLAPENVRRDDGKSNIVLIKKECKEIRTMFPTNGVDGVILYGDYYQDQSTTKQSGTVLATSDNLFLITSGTGAVSSGSYKNTASTIGMNSVNPNLVGTIINSEGTDTFTKTPTINNKLINKLTTDGTLLIGKNLLTNVNKIVSGVDLVKINGELYLKVRSVYSNNNSVNNTSGYTTVDYKLTNRNLIK